MFVARYKSITQIIRKSGASQVLELACGYSLREVITGVTQRHLDASAFEDADDLTAFLAALASTTPMMR